MSKYRKTFGSVGRFSRIFERLQSGATPAELHGEMRAALAPHFHNLGILDEIQPFIGIQEAVNVERISADVWSLDRFKMCLDFYWQACIVNPQGCCDEIVRWDPDVDAGLNHYWSLVQLQQTEKELDLEDFAAEVFRSIGMLLEACLQPYLRELLSQIRLARAKNTDNIGELNFGNIVSELAGTAPLPDLFAPPPYRIPLNQWRNTPQHFKYVVDKDQVLAEFGEGARVRRLTFNEQDLAVAFKALMDTYRVIRTARTLFFLDNLVALRERIPPKAPRKDLAFFDFVTLAGAQGFDVIEADIGAEEARAVLQDVIGGDRAARAIHAGQLVVQLWSQTQRSRCAIEARDINGVPALVTIASAADCQAVASGGLSLAALAERVGLRPPTLPEDAGRRAEERNGA